MNFLPKTLIQRKLTLKIWLFMSIPTLIILLVIGMFFNTYYRHISLQTSVERAERETDYVAASMSESTRDLLMRFVRRSSSSYFAECFQKMQHCTPIQYTDVNNELQELFTDYTGMSNLVSSILFVTVDDDPADSLKFYAYSKRLNQNDFTYDLGFPEESISGLTILPNCKSPFSNESDVIPIVIPLYYDSGQELILISKDISDAEIVLYFFLSTSKINEYLALYCSDDSQGLMFLTDNNGSPISAPPIDFTSKAAISFSDKLTSALNSDASYFTHDSQYVFLSTINNLGLCLVNAVPEDLFADSFHSFNRFLIVIAIICLFTITAVSLLVSILVTTPLNKLMQSVTAIQDNHYQGRADIQTRDEIGQLNTAIDSMYNTIQEQMLTIRRNEEEKYKARMQLLAEQMNPHFLYNALEFINMEVFSGHAETASLMISSLGEYLRIGLSYGQNEIYISREIEQVKAYVNIMNYRFQHSIQLTVNVPTILMGHKIVKCTLQPLVENSLKHGFQFGIRNNFPLTPMLDISILLDEEYLTISVADNGVGIDIDKATAALQSSAPAEGSDRHFGLNNVYERLKSAYGDVIVDFSSIPFFENKITLKLPAQYFKENV